jgi:hypothetical protein
MPTVTVDPSTWAVNAINPGGSVGVQLTFGVEIPQAFFYGSCFPPVELTTLQYTVGVAAQFFESSIDTTGPLTPIIQGGCSSNGLSPAYLNGVEPWSISPALPAGLIFSNSMGTISGTPTALSAPTDYAVTGGSPGGQMSVHLTLGVSSNVALYLGHDTALQAIQFGPSRVLSQESTGGWALWNYATSAEIASGNSGSFVAYRTGMLSPDPVALAGPTVAIGTVTGVELRSSATGTVLAEIPIPVTWWKLASDGIYVCGGTSTELACWSSTGTLLFSKSGNYANAVAFAAPSELLVALGAAGQNVIETVSTASWTSSVGPAFQGQFDAWFLDGGRFLTTVGSSSTVYVYSSATVLEDARSLPSLANLTGQGNWFWTNPNPLNVYAVGNSALPTATFSIGSPVPTGMYITSLSGTGSGALTIIDLSGATPIETSYTVPAISVPPGSPAPCYQYPSITAYAWNSPSQLMLGVCDGLVIDASNPSAPRTFGFGAITNLAGSTARVVFTTASGNNFSYESASNTLQKTIDLSAVQQLVLSSDGSALAALEEGPGAGNVTVNIYAMPAGTLIHSFQYSTAGSYPTSIALSGGGTVLGEFLYISNCGGCLPQTVPIAGGAVTSYPSGSPGAMQLSPDGTLAAITQISALTTNIYQNGTLVATTIPGYAAAWLDNGRLLVTSAGNTASIYSPAGGLLGTAPISTLNPVQVVSPNLVYVPQLNEVLSLTSGNSVWASGDSCGVTPFIYINTCFDAFAGSAIVFNSENVVLVQPY